MKEAILLVYTIIISKYVQYITVPTNNSHVNECSTTNGI